MFGLVAVGEDASDELIEEVFSDGCGNIDNASHFKGCVVEALDVFTSPASG